MTPLLDFLRRRLWTIALGMALASVLWWALGPGAVAGILLLIVAAAVIVRFVVPQSPLLLPRAPKAEEPGWRSCRPWCARCWARCRCR